MGGIANDSFQLSQFFEKDETWECYTVWYILQTCFRLVFIIIQAHFLFKHHKVRHPMDIYDGYLNVCGPLVLLHFNILRFKM